MEKITRSSINIWCASRINFGSINFRYFYKIFIFTKKKSEPHNFADDNTIGSAKDTIGDLIENLERDSKSTIDWFINNEMLLSLNKFQAIIMKRNNKMIDEYILNIREAKVTSEILVTLI